MKAILVALSPAVICAGLVFIVEGIPRLKSWAIALLQSRAKLETLKELLAHTAFYGSVIGGLLGYKKESIETYYFATAWLIVLLFATFRMVRRLEKIEELEETRLHRKMAGTVRSIVRYELERAASSKQGGIPA